MAKRTCTDARPCNLMTCYGCRRRQIDVTAETMIQMNMDQEAVDRYRYSAINNLAFEIIPPAPKPQPKARKAPAAVDPELVQATLRALRAATSRAGGHYHLKGLTVVQLRAVAKAIDLGACSGKRKDDLISHLIDFTVQMKLDHDAILMAGRR